MSTVSPTSKGVGTLLDRAAVSAASGDAAALAHIVDTVAPIVARWCRAELGDDAHAAEVCRASLARLPGADRPLFAIVADEVARRRTRRSASDPLRSLRRPERTVLALRVVVGLSVADTASALGVTTSAILLYQHRALARLRETGRGRGVSPARR